MTIAIVVVIVGIVVVIGEWGGCGDEGEADGEEGSGDCFGDAESVFFEPPEDDRRVGRAVENDGIGQPDCDVSWFGRIGELDFEGGGGDCAGCGYRGGKVAFGFGTAKEVVCLASADFVEGVVAGHFKPAETRFGDFGDAGGVEGVRAVGPEGFKGEAGVRGQRNLLSGFGFPHL